mgnify:CR=1 FL=1
MNDEYAKHESLMSKIMAILYQLEFVWNNEDLFRSP